jgi:hypothetical protein
MVFPRRILQFLLGNIVKDAFRWPGRLWWFCVACVFQEGFNIQTCAIPWWWNQVCSAPTWKPERSTWWLQKNTTINSPANGKQTHTNNPMDTYREMTTTKTTGAYQGLSNPRNIYHVCNVASKSRQKKRIG